MKKTVIFKGDWGEFKITNCRIETRVDNNLNEFIVYIPTRNSKLIITEVVKEKLNLEELPGEIREFVENELKPKKRGGKSVKRKGTRFEREVVDRLEELGLNVKRVPLSGAGDIKGDILIYGETDNSKYEFSCGCKVRHKLPEWMVRDLENFYCLFVKEDRGRIYVVLPVEEFAYLFKEYYSKRGLK